MAVLGLENPPKKTEFTRYHLQHAETPHRKQIPHPFIPKVDKLGLAKLLLKEAFHYNFKLVKPSYRKVLLSRPCIYGVFSGPLGGFAPITERCTGCMRCVLEYPGVCQVEDNLEFTKYVDAYWAPADPSNMAESPYATILYEAKTGKIQVRGMGYKGLFSAPGWDSMWTDMSEIVRPTRDGVYGREFISTQVDLGSRLPRLQITSKQDIITKDRGGHKVEPKSVSIKIPVIFDYLPPNIATTSILLSIATAANTSDSLFVVSFDQLEKIKDKLATVKKISPMPTSPRVPVFPEENALLYIDNVNVLEKIGSLSKVRGFLLDESYLEDVNYIRELHPTKPIFVRLKSGQFILEDIPSILDLGIDGLYLCSDYHGQSYGNNQRFIKESIQELHQYLVDKGRRDHISIISSGGITLAEHVPKAIICGSDAVAINTTTLIALQVRFEGECRIPESCKVSDGLFELEWGTQRLVNVITSWHGQLIEIMSAMGIKDVRRLRGDTGRAMFHEKLEEIAFAGIERID